MIAQRPIIVCSGVNPNNPPCNTGVAHAIDRPQPKQNLVPDDGVFASIDWLTATVPEPGRADTRSTMEGIFGPSKPGTPIRFYPDTLAFEDDGVVLGWSAQNVAQGTIAQVHGHWFLHHPADVGLEVVRELGHALGMGYTRRTTRIDLALDFIRTPGISETLIPEFTDAGHNGRYRRFDTFEDHNSYRRTAKPSRKQGVNFGSRESECYLRVYDKGLEQKILPPGQWVRLEAEFKGTKAPQVRDSILEADEPFQCIAEHVTGTIDFPAMPLWSRVLDHVGGGVRVKPAQEQPTYERWLSGLQKSYGRALVALCEVQGLQTDAEVGSYVRRLLADLEPNHDAPVVRIVREQLARTNQP